MAILPTTSGSRALPPAATRSTASMKASTSPTRSRAEQVLRVARLRDDLAARLGQKARDALAQ
jgi:hypothetical protein